MGKQDKFDMNSDVVNYNNYSQGLIHITEDKLKVILYENEQKINKFYSWTTPLGIFLSCFFATFAADFKDVFYIPKNTWQAIFIIITIISFLWFIYAAYNAFINRKGRGIDKLIEKIKNEEKTKS